jgi:3'-phosphoadenosine 5'-phosphosulfate sulfotransferase (PAPS reductase)/FAD synthetase
MRWLRVGSTRRLGAPDATKKNRARKKEFIRSGTRTVNGIPRISGRSCGTSLIRASINLSNWTELDIWLYIFANNIPIVPLYYAKERETVLRNGSLVLIHDRREVRPGEQPKLVKCRMRSLGCVPCTGAIRSEADTLPKIIEEMISFRRSERENRAIDHDEEGSMEMKKREGYF